MCTATFGVGDFPSTVQPHVARRTRRAFYTRKDDVVKVDVVENLLTFLKNPDADSPPDVSAWALAAELALRTGDSGCISDMLLEQSVPVPSAERLAAHRKVNPGALGTFLSRPDLPSDVLLNYIRREQRPVVLAPVASAPDLPDAVYSQLAKSQAVSVRSALLENPSVLPAVKLTVFERYVSQTDVPDGHARHVHHVVSAEPALHQAAFDAARSCWEPHRLLEVFPRWSGLHPDQTDFLLTVAENMLRADPTSHGMYRDRVEQALRSIATYPGLSDSVLAHFDAVAELMLPDLSGFVAQAVKDAHARHAADQTGPSLRSASRSQLSSRITAGTVRTEAQVLALAKNPVFDPGLASQLLVKLSTVRHSLGFESVDRFVAAAVASPADLLQVLMSCRQEWSFEHWLGSDTVLRVFADASSDELIEALTVARPQPAWRRFVELATAAHNSTALTDDVIAHFGWQSPETAYISQQRTVQPYVALIRDRVGLFLLRRLGTEPAVWSAFSSIVDGSVSLGDTADLAVLAGTSPEHQ